VRPYTKPPSLALSKKLVQALLTNGAKTSVAERDAATIFLIIFCFMKILSRVKLDLKAAALL
jgi:hypothetical protein